MKSFSELRSGFNQLSIWKKFEFSLFYLLCGISLLLCLHIAYVLISIYFDAQESEKQERLAEVAAKRSEVAEKQFQLDYPCETTRKDPALAVKLYQERRAIALENKEQYPSAFFFPECEERYQQRVKQCKQQGSDLSCDSPQKKSRLNMNYGCYEWR